MSERSKQVLPSYRWVTVAIHHIWYALYRYSFGIVFTAAHQSYADVVLDHIDPTRELFQYRLYRDSCTMIEPGVYVKDLGIIKNRKLENMVIVDNSLHSFGFHLDNGVPIVPFYDNQDDEELNHLKAYLT